MGLKDPEYGGDPSVKESNELHDGKRVLLVGLDDELVYSLSGRLFYRGFMFEAATTGRQALERASATEFQTAVLDANIQDMDGIEVARKLRERDENIKLIIISDYDSLSKCIDFLDIGIEEIVLKPVEPGELLNLLEPSADH